MGKKKRTINDYGIKKKGNNEFYVYEKNRKDIYIFFAESEKEVKWFIRKRVKAINSAKPSTIFPELNKALKNLK